MTQELSPRQTVIGFMDLSKLSCREAPVFLLTARIAYARSLSLYHRLNMKA